MFHLTKQIEESIEPFRAINSELSGIELLKKVLQEYHAAYFSCAKLQLSLKTMQNSSTELQSAVALLKQIFTINHPLEIGH